MGNRCHECGAPMVAAGDSPYASSVVVCSLKGSACNYAAGLLQRAKKAEAALKRIEDVADSLWEDGFTEGARRIEQALEASDE